MKYDFYDNMSLLNSMMPNDYDNYTSNMNNYPNSITKNNMKQVNSNTLDYDINNTNIPNKGNSNLNLYSPYEGYINGNGFKDQYIPYKNYRPQKPNITSEQEEMLVNIGQYGFMAHEMNLYLDNYPNNQDALNKFQEFRNRANELTNMYERKYGPINLNGVTNNIPFSWENGSWPWVN